MLVGSDGLGYLINSSKLYYKTGWAFAGIVSLAVLGFIADRLLLLAGANDDLTKTCNPEYKLPDDKMIWSIEYPRRVGS